MPCIYSLLCICSDIPPKKALPLCPRQAGLQDRVVQVHSAMVLGLLGKTLNSKISFP